MKKKILSILLLLSIFLMSCQLLSDAAPGGSPADKPPAGSSQKGKSPGADFIFSPPAEPASASVSPDSARSVEKTIPVAGGEIQAQGADGTLYTLQVPGDALEVDTTIKMTPAAVAGLPFGQGPALAVQLEPDGLAFLNYVTLTITPKEEIPLKEQIFFGFQAGGKDVILAAPAADSREIRLKLLHFSGAGVTKGLLADIEPLRERLGGDAERRIQSEVGERLQRERQRQLLGGDDKEITGLDEILSDAFTRYEKEVVAPRVAAAGESCAAGRLALQTVLGYERQRQLLGAADDSGLSKYADLIDTVSRVCMKEEYELCASQHIIHRIIPVWLGMERQRQLLGSENSALLKEGEELVKKCLTFELQFHSESNFDAGGGDGFTSSVDAKIPLKFDPGKMSITGTTALVNQDFEFRVKGCSTNSQRGGSSVAVMSLVPVSDTRSLQDQLGHVRDFTLMYFPERTSEVFTVKCKDSPLYTSPPSGLWWSVYLVLHAEELQTGGEAGAAPPAPAMPDMSGMLAGAESGFAMPMLPVPMVSQGAGFQVTDWEVFGNDYFAKKEWIKDDGSLGISEVGTLKLYHRPEK